VARTAQNAGWIQYKSLHDFTCVLVAHARAHAKEGNKDFARDVARYVTNARILELLEIHLVEVPISINLDQLRRDLKLLAQECHPVDAPQFRTELEGINDRLQNLERMVSQRPFVQPEIISGGLDVKACGENVPAGRRSA
jgi:hypothetical protein